MILHNALTSVERRDAHSKGKQEGFVSCSTWDGCRGECQTGPAAQQDMSLRQPQPLAQPSSTASPFPLLLHKERETKLREVWSSRKGKETPRSGWMERSKGDAGAQHHALPLLQYHSPSGLSCGSCGTQHPQLLRAVSGMFVSHSPFSPISGGTDPKTHNHGMIEVQGFTCRGGDSGECRVTLVSVWKDKRDKKEIKKR